MNECIFCKIINKEIQANIVYEDVDTIAFLDVNPNSHGHTLVIPKYHYENLYTLPGEELCKTMLIVQKIALAVKEATEADGLTVVMNTEIACHMKDHAHIHIIPRHENDGFAEWPHKPYIGTEAEIVKNKIIEELGK